MKSAILLEFEEPVNLIFCGFRDSNISYWWELAVSFTKEKTLLEGPWPEKQSCLHFLNNAHTYLSLQLIFSKLTK